jgi:hypothetical protein
VEVEDGNEKRWETKEVPGITIFIDSKGYKHRMKTDKFSKLMTIYKDKVWLCQPLLMID